MSAGQGGLMTVADDAVFAESLKERFHYGAVWYLERAERRGGELGITEEQTVDLFRHLERSVDAVPPALMSDAHRLYASQPDAVEAVLQRMLEQTGRLYHPDDATTFLKALVANARGRAN
jgi:hypothetical protein